MGTFDRPAVASGGAPHPRGRHLSRRGWIDHHSAAAMTRGASRALCLSRTVVGWPHGWRDAVLGVVHCDSFDSLAGAIKRVMQVQRRPDAPSHSGV